MDDLEFIKSLRRSSIKHKRLLHLTNEAAKRLNIYRILYESLRKIDETAFGTYLKNKHQTEMETKILQMITDYQIWMTGGRTLLEERRSTAVAPTPSLALPVKAAATTNSCCAQPSASRVVYVNSTAAHESTTHSSMTHSTVAAHHPDETLLLRGQNEMRREHWAKVEGSHYSSNSSSVSHGSQSSSNEHHPYRHGSLAKDCDSNVSSHSASSIIHREAVIEQPQFFGRKRRSQAADEQQQQLPASKIDSSPMAKKVCLHEIIDSVNEQAQAGRDDDEEESDVSQ